MIGFAGASRDRCRSAPSPGPWKAHLQFAFIRFHCTTPPIFPRTPPGCATMVVLEGIFQSEFNDALSVFDIGKAELLVVVDKLPRRVLRHVETNRVSVGIEGP